MGECNKKSFRSRAEARSFANANRKRNGLQRPYPCADDPEHRRGGVWHLTGMPTTHVTWYRDTYSEAARKRRKRKRRRQRQRRETGDQI